MSDLIIPEYCETCGARIRVRQMIALGTRLACDECGLRVFLTNTHPRVEAIKNKITVIQFRMLQHISSVHTPEFGPTRVRISADLPGQLEQMQELGVLEPDGKNGYRVTDEGLLALYQLKQPQ